MMPKPFNDGNNPTKWIVCVSVCEFLVACQMNYRQIQRENGKWKMESISWPLFWEIHFMSDQISIHYSNNMNI